jgi:chemotaxis protein MotB
MIDESNQQAKKKGPEEEIPKWMTTFTDLILLLLTFFVLLLSFSKTETQKYQSSLGSLREAFGGNIYLQGEAVEAGKTIDNMPIIMESKQYIRPFPIDFSTTDGFFDKFEINRESQEHLKSMKKNLKEFNLDQSALIHEMPEGIKIRFKDRILFKTGSLKIAKMSTNTLEEIRKLLVKNDWNLFIEGHSAPEEIPLNKKWDTYSLSSQRATKVAKFFLEKGVPPERITTIFYGDSRPIKVDDKVNLPLSQRVEMFIRIKDLQTPGFKIHGR